MRASNTVINSKAPITMNKAIGLIQGREGGASRFGRFSVLCHLIRETSAREGRGGLYRSDNPQGRAGQCVSLPLTEYIPQSN